MVASSNLGHINIQLDLAHVLDAFKIVMRIKHLCYQQLNEHRSQDVESTLKSLCQLITYKYQAAATHFSTITRLYWSDYITEKQLMDALEGEHAIETDVKRNQPRNPRAKNGRGRRNVTHSNFNTVENIVANSENSENVDVVSVTEPVTATSSTERYRLGIDGNEIVTRKKRFVMLALAGLFAGWAASSLFNMLSSKKIDDLVDATEGLSSAQEHLVHAIKSNSKEIAWNRKSLKSLARTMVHFESAIQSLQFEINMMIATMYADAIIHSLNLRLTTFETAILAANNGKLAPGLITAEAAKDSLERISEMAAAKGLTLLVNDPTSLYNMPVSYVFKGSKLNIIVHCYLAHQSQYFSLHEYQSFPIRIEDRLEAMIQPHKTILALSKSQDARDIPLGLYVDMTEDDLASCHSYYQFKVCPEISVFRKKVYSTCLYALYFSSHSEVAEKCAVYIQRAQPTAVMIKNNRYLTVTNSTSYSTYCYVNGSISEGNQATKTDVIDTSPGCSVELDELRLNSRTDLYISATMKTYQWSLPIDDLFHGMDNDDVHAAMVALEKISHHGAVSLDSIKAYRAHLQPVSFTAVLGYTALSCGIIAVLVLVSFVTYSICQAKRKYAHDLQRERERDLERDERTENLILRHIAPRTETSE